MGTFNQRGSNPASSYSGPTSHEACQHCQRPYVGVGAVCQECADYFRFLDQIEVEIGNMKAALVKYEKARAEDKLTVGDYVRLATLAAAFGLVVYTVIRSLT